MARDYKAEYRRRVAKGRREGKTRQQARGHAPKRAGVSEYQERAARVRQIHGQITPRQLTVIRKEAIDHVLEQLRSEPTRHRINEFTLRRRLNRLRAETLGYLSQIDGRGLRNLAGLSAPAIAENPIFQAEPWWGEDYADYDDADFENPLWYGDK